MASQLPEALRTALRELTGRLQQELGDNLREVRLFGSHARGEAYADSDVDVLVVVEDACLAVRDRVSDIAADVGLDHDVAIATLTWDTDHLNQHEILQTLLIRNIRSEGVVLWNHP